MQYKTNIKIIVDKRKLDILLRLKCPEEILWEAIKTGEVHKTGDSLIDETLETLVDIKEFKNWGGSRKGSGRKSKFNQDENQLENQDESNLEDKDIDIDKDINNSINSTNNTNINKPKDIFCNSDFEKCFSIYKEVCTKLTPLRFERRSKAILEELSTFLDEIEYNFDYFKELCEKANQLEKIVDSKIDFKTMIKNHIGITNGKYDKKEQVDISKYFV